MALGAVFVGVSSPALAVSPPSIINPIGGAVLVNQNPVFSWTTIPGATAYGIELLDSAPSAGEANGTVAGVHRIAAGATNRTTWNGDVRTLAAGIYYYRIIAWNDNGFLCGFSNADSFTVPKPFINPVDTTIPDKPSFSWGAIAGADGYIVEIDSAVPENPNDAAASRFRVTSGTSTGISWIGTTRYCTAGTYFARVQAQKGGSNLGGYSDSVSFVVNSSVVLRPQLKSSFGGTTLLNQFPVFSWTGVSGASQYGVELLSAAPVLPNGNSPDPKRIAFGTKSNLIWNGDTRGMGAGTFFYRVIANDAGGLVGAYSLADSFSLPKPSLNAITWSNNITPGFSWAAVPGATKYGVELLTNPPENPNEAYPSKYRLAAGVTMDTSWPGSTIGLNGGRYYVRNIAANGNGLLGGFSDAKSFDVVRPNLNEVTWNGLTSPYFSWSPIAGATCYGLEILSAPPENPNGTTPSRYRIGATGLKGTSTQGDTNGLPAGWYWWRVIAGDANGHVVGTFSNAGVFFYLAPGPKSIDVNLSTQVLTVCMGGFPYRTFLMSTGRSGYETPTGNYSIGEKYVSIAMSGPDYMIPDVPYAMHVVRGIFIHGCYWHNNFGTPMSHGCINVSVDNAAWLFDWTPYGTPVNIHY